MSRLRSRQINIAVGLMLALAICSSILKAQGRASRKPDNGIEVQDVKVFDSAALENILATALQKQAALSGFDQTSLTNSLAKIQGGTVDQSQISFQANGGVKPGTAIAPSNQNQALSPSIAAPSGFSTLSPADLLNEQTQLFYQITGLQLLLQGALSDRGKTPLTLGFPIDVATPPGYQYREAVAEVEVSVCIPPGVYYAGYSQDPSLVTLIPQEKTYNVASIVTKTSSISGGVVANVFNLSGSLFHGHQTFYVVKDQDTLATSRRSAKVCKAQAVNGQNSQELNALTFAWQFRPVLGQKVVQGGRRQTFAQLALPTSQQSLVNCSALVYIDTRWRRYESKTGRVGKIIPGTEREDQQRYFTYGQPPVPRTAFAQDNGDGSVTVTVSGTFKTGTKVRIGSLILDSNSPTLFSLSDSSIRFTASGSQLALIGAKLVDGSGMESDIPTITPDPPGCMTNVYEQSDGAASGKSGSQLSLLFHAHTAAEEATRNQKPNPAQAAVGEAEAAAQKAENAAAFAETQAGKASSAADRALTAQAAATKGPATTATAGPATITPSVVPINETTSKLTLALDPPLTRDPNGFKIPLIVIGNSVYGLRNTSPFLDLAQDHVTMAVSNDVLRANRTARIVVLFDEDIAQSHTIDLPATMGPLLGTPSIVLLGSGNPGSPTTSKFAIIGKNLTNLKILSPEDKKIDTNSDNLITFSVPDTEATKLKYVVVRNSSDVPFVLTISSSAPASTDSSTSSKCSLKPQSSAIAASAVTQPLSISGTGLTQVAAIFYNATPLPFSATSDTALTVALQTAQGSALNPALAAPQYTLQIVCADKSQFSYLVPVQATATTK